MKIKFGLLLKVSILFLLFATLVGLISSYVQKAINVNTSLFLFAELMAMVGVQYYVAKHLIVKTYKSCGYVNIYAWIIINILLISGVGFLTVKHGVSVSDLSQNLFNMVLMFLAIATGVRAGIWNIRETDNQ